MSKIKQLQIFYNFMDLVTNYDYADCDNFNEFVSKVFSIVMKELDEEERKK